MKKIFCMEICHGRASLDPLKKYWVSCLLVLCSLSVAGQWKSRYAGIPRIDVHTHVSDNYELIRNYLDLRQLILDRNSAELAMWIDLGDEKKPLRNIDSIKLVSKGRILSCFSDFAPAKGMHFRPEDLEPAIKKGYLGMKIWYGPWYRTLKPEDKGFRYADDPANEKIFAELEKKGIRLSSIHIADPNGPFGNRTEWCADPVEYWREITGFHNVLRKHPNLKVIAAHGLWLVCQDAQLDYLRFLLETYPGLNVDLAATFQYFYLVTYDNLRDFMIKYSDRIMFGTDISKWKGSKATEDKAAAYTRCFRILETDETVEGSFFGNKPIRGLNLPEDVLEKIYYKNAVNFYPELKKGMIELGYKL